jgi:hypothetical protein
MHRPAKYIAIAAIALIALLAAAGTASAFRLTIRPGGAISAASLGNLTFEAGVSIACPITLNGSLLTSATIVAGTRLGTITEATWNSSHCEGGEISMFLVELAWNISLDSIPAGLPNEVRGFSIRISSFATRYSTLGGFINCLYAYRSERFMLASVSVARTASAGVYTTGLWGIQGNTSSLVSGGFACPGTGSYRGTFGLNPTQTLTIS